MKKDCLNIDAPDNDGWKPLDVTCYFGHKEVVYILLSQSPTLSHYMVLSDRPAKAVTEWTIKRGETCVSYGPDRNGWRACKNTQTGEIGNIPCNYLQETNPSKSYLKNPLDSTQTNYKISKTIQH